MSDVYPTIDPNSYEKRFRSIVQLERISARLQSGWGRRPEQYGDAAVIWAASMRKRGQLKFHAHRLRAMNWRDYEERGNRISTRGESAIHIAMKLAAVEWLRGQGMPDAETEVWCDGMRFDACSVKGETVVEVGHTPIGKLYYCAMQNMRFCLIPFRRDDYKHLERSVLIEFVMSDEARNAAREEHAEREAEMFDRWREVQDRAFPI